tara:strand:- start:4335 stop:4526 length:192 start_codon:yes stop_codon:yes gene_type:complete
MSEYIDKYLEDNMVKQDDESMATYIYRTVNKNYNEMNPPSFQRFLDQMLLLCKDIDKNKFQKE